MIEPFVNFIREKKLFQPDDRILLAVSGGADSVAMTHLFHAAGFRFGLAHCNFGLRGIESDGDEMFVADLAAALKVSFFSTSFDTHNYAKSKGISIQMAARELRYDWFEEIRQKHSFQYIATAHQKDDQTETILLNIIRGTGIRGLEGIPLKTDTIIRPILFASRDEIQQFLADQGLRFREDSSNSDDKYTRNKIRHILIPALREINPSLDKAMVNLSTIAHDTQQLLKYFIDVFAAKHTWLAEDAFHISLNALNELPSAEVVLYELLKPYGFQGDVVREIAAGLQGQSGKMFYAQTHVCLKDREALIIYKSRQHPDATHEIDETTTTVQLPEGIIMLTRYTIDLLPEFSKDPNVAYLDMDRIVYPLVLRNPDTGDYFYPLGMSGKKKLSDYFTDKKIPHLQKEKVWLLCSEGEIIWVVGMRADDRFKVKNSSKSILEMKFVPHSK